MRERGSALFHPCLAWFAYMPLLRSGSFASGRPLVFPVLLNPESKLAQLLRTWKLIPEGITRTSVSQFALTSGACVDFRPDAL